MFQVEDVLGMLSVDHYNYLNSTVEISYVGFPRWHNQVSVADFISRFSSVYSPLTAYFLIKKAIENKRGHYWCTIYRDG